MIAFVHGQYTLSADEEREVLEDAAALEASGTAAVTARQIALHDLVAFRLEHTALSMFKITLVKEL